VSLEGKKSIGRVGPGKKLNVGASQRDGSKNRPTQDNGTEGEWSREKKGKILRMNWARKKRFQKTNRGGKRKGGDGSDRKVLLS